MAWWENEFLKAKKGKLCLGEKEAVKVAQSHGTPIFVYSNEQILSNFSALHKAFTERAPLDIRICYAMKANPHREILKILKEAGAWIDAVSPGEVEEALRAGFPSKKILFTGTSLSTEDLKQAFKHDSLVINIDAEEQLELMKEVKERWYRNKKIRVAVRWNPGIGIGFSPKTITAGERLSGKIPVKFGVADRKVIPTFVRAKSYGFVPVALHQHLGSGWSRADFKDVRRAVDRMVEKASEIQDHGIKIEFLDLGGGFGPRYSPDQEIFPVKDYAEYICRKIKKSGLKIKAIAVEPGKYLVGDAGALLVRVEYVKRSFRNTFACVNAGTFNTVPRPAIYAEAYHHILNCSNITQGKRERVTVVGNLCETGDVFGRKVEMPLPRRGDILAVLCAGAYCRSMASNFNLRPIPKEIVI